MADQRNIRSPRISACAKATFPLSIASSLAANNAVAMYSRLIKAFNYALGRLPNVKVPGLLPELVDSKPRSQFTRDSARCIESNSYFQGSYKPDTALVQWKTFKAIPRCEEAANLNAYISDICCKSGRDQPKPQLAKLLVDVDVGGEAQSSCRFRKCGWRRTVRGRGDERIYQTNLNAGPPQLVPWDSHHPPT